MMLNNGQEMPGAMWLLMSAGQLVFWVAVIVALALVARRETFARPAPAAMPLTARGVLAARYARGEIDEYEYDERLTVLVEREPLSES